MQSCEHSEEEQRNAMHNLTASPRMSNKSTTGSTLFGLLTKRSTRIEPQQQQPPHQQQHPQYEQPSQHDSAKQSRPSSAAEQQQQQHDQHNAQQPNDVNFAKCSTEYATNHCSTTTAAALGPTSLPNQVQQQQNRNKQQKSLTLPANPLANATANHNLEKSHSSSGLIGLQRKFKSSKSSSKASAQQQHQLPPNYLAQPESYICTDGSQSDGGLTITTAGDTAKVKMRKSQHKYRSPNHNRFSHQFSLCCKAEKKPLTPPVTVRYNSIPDANNVVRRENLTLSWHVGGTTVTNNMITTTTKDAEGLVVNVGSSEALLGSLKEAQLVATLAPTKNPVLECASAPESPVTAKTMMFPAQNSPSHSSMRSGHSGDTTGQVGIGGSGNGSSSSNTTIGGVSSSASGGLAGAVGPVATGSGPIRPMAVSACRSRLRLKLYPPGKELPPLLSTTKPNETPGEVMKRATTPQHMSSPNIATQTDEFAGIGLASSAAGGGGFGAGAGGVCNLNGAGYNQREGVEAHGVRFMSHENIQMQRQASSSGLARQALMAAQVLSLIPTEKARERSFMDGRLGSSSLLGPSELTRVLPTKEVTIFVGTWNMNGQSPPKQMNDFVLPATIEHVPDIVAIGTQESSPDRFEWEVTLQETLGPSHVLFHSTTLGTLHLAIYMRRDLIWYCSAPEDASMSVRTGSAFRTKGAVAISFCLFGTSMLFVTSHLTAHQQKVKERVSDVKRIIHALDLPRNLNLRHKNKDVTQNFDNVFWCGDLNFRLGEPREKLLEWIQNTKFPLPSHLPHGYMHTDQLSSVLSDGAAFRGFMEANITFPPTYKYDPGTQHFDTSSKQRAPAYTDRILYKYRQSQGLVIRRQSTVSGIPTPAPAYVQCLLYDSVPSITTSDHKPVWALFNTLIRAGSDSIPLAAGLFNRDIYLEGMKRRLNNQYTGSSAVCVLQ